MEVIIILAWTIRFRWLLHYWSRANKSVDNYMVAQGHYLFPQFIHWTLETGCPVRMLQWGYWGNILSHCDMVAELFYLLAFSVKQFGIMSCRCNLTHYTGSWIVEIKWLIDSNDKRFSLTVSLILIGLYGWLLLPSLDWRGNLRTEEQIQSSFDSF